MVHEDLLAIQSLVNLLDSSSREANDAILTAFKRVPAILVVTRVRLVCLRSSPGWEKADRFGGLRLVVVVLCTTAHHVNHSPSLHLALQALHLQLVARCNGLASHEVFLIADAARRTADRALLRVPHVGLARLLGSPRRANAVEKTPLQDGARCNSHYALGILDQTQRLVLVTLAHNATRVAVSLLLLLLVDIQECLLALVRLRV